MTSCLAGATLPHPLPISLPLPLAWPHPLYIVFPKRDTIFSHVTHFWIDELKRVNTNFYHENADGNKVITRMEKIM